MIYLIRNILIQKARGSALVFALLMTTVLAVICAIVLRMEFFRLSFINKKIHKKEALYYAEAGIYKTLWYLSGHEGYTKDWRPQREPVETLMDKICYVTVKEWGAYLEVSSLINYKGITDSIQVTVAEKPSSIYSQAVVVGDSEYSLVVTGENKIIGDVEVGRKGVETGKIEGKGFVGKTPVQGTIRRRDNPRLPFFNPSLFHKVYDTYEYDLQYEQDCIIFHHNLYLTDEIIQESEPGDIYVNGHIFITDSLLRKPLRRPLKLIATGSIFITDSVSIREKVEIIAAEKIHITDRASLEQGIIFAQGGVEISGQSSVSAQIFSGKDMVIKEHAVIKYPSILYSSGWVDDITLRGKIVIQDNARVMGTVILYPYERDLSVQKQETIIHILPGATVGGVVYSHHFVDLKGCVYGTVVTSSFYLYRSPTSYINWLKDAVIDRTQLPDGFLMPLSFRSDPEYEVLFWGW